MLLIVKFVCNFACHLSTLLSSPLLYSTLLFSYGDRGLGEGDKQTYNQYSYNNLSRRFSGDQGSLPGRGGVVKGGVVKGGEPVT